MNKRLQVVFTDEAWQTVEAIAKEANENFDVGSISYSDVISEMIMSSKVDVKTLQIKHTDLRRSLRSMASKAEVDLDSVIKSLTELKNRSTRKRASASIEEAS